MMLQNKPILLRIKVLIFHKTKQPAFESIWFDLLKVT